MNLALTPSNATHPLGEPSNRHLLRLNSGPFARRLVALLHTTPNTISLVWSDFPYTTASTPQTIATDAADTPFDCCLDENNGILVVYSDQTTGNLVSRKLTLTSGTWTVGTKITVFDNGPCYSPSVTVTPDGTLWVAFARYTAPNRTFYCKSSVDSGATWGTGPSDPGDIVSDAAMFLSARLLSDSSNLLLLLAYGTSRIACRTRAQNGSSWSTETQLAASSNISVNFDAALSPAGAIGLAFLDGTQLRYREYDGVTWSPAVTLAATALSPQVVFRGETPVVIFLAPFDSAQAQLTYVYRSDTAFTSPAPLDPRSRTFDSVILYDQLTGSFADLSVPAQNATSADVYHPSTFALLKTAGDRLYLGMDRPFRYIQLSLFTPGDGGTVTYSYWDGSSWIPVTPSSGPSHLTAAATRIVLWNDYSSIPVTWQKSSVGSQNRFWIRVEVTSAYTTPPIASRISSIPESTAVSCARN